MGSLVQVQRNGKRRLVSEQTQRDSIRLNERMKRNAGRIPVIEFWLEHACGRMTMTNLVALADRCVDALDNSIGLDRLSKRSRSALICWFCENWSVIWPAVLQDQNATTTFRPGHPVEISHIQPVHQLDDIHPLSIVALLNH
jgi:hypothetical protein